MSFIKPSSWRRGRKVRILHPAYGYKGKIGTISNLGKRGVYVRVPLGKKPDEWDEVVYDTPNEQLRLI